MSSDHPDINYTSLESIATFNKQTKHQRRINEAERKAKGVLRNAEA